MLPPRAYTFLGLNAIRALSLIALLLVFASSIVVMANDIKAVNAFVAAGSDNAGNSTDTDSMIDCDYIEGSTVPNEPAGAFWAVLNRLLIILETLFLILSEIGWPMAFFNRFFPVLGSEFGLGPLGIFECLIASSVLSHHVGEFALVSAFFLFAIGCLNMFAGLIFRGSAKSKRSITSWRDRAKAVLPSASKVPNIRMAFSSTPSYKTDAESDSGMINEKAGYGFGRMGEKKAGLKGFLISKPMESLPRYAPKPNGGATSSRASSPVFGSSATAI